MSSSRSKMTSAVTRAYCATQVRVASRHRGRELGQSLVEYLGLIVIIAGALALAAAAGENGPLVGFFRNAVQGGLNKALERLGITVPDQG